jgi:hypothetical protein
MKTLKCYLRIVLLIAIGLSWNPVVWADLNDELVAYYPFNGNVKDESGNGNHGVIRLFQNSLYYCRASLGCISY